MTANVRHAGKTATIMPVCPAVCGMALFIDITVG
jgi:hypothetical protein